MERTEIRNRVFSFFKGQCELIVERPHNTPNIQMGTLLHTFEEPTRELPMHERTAAYSVVREVVQELINNGFLYPGTAGDQNSGLPWLTITTHGKEAFVIDNWLPYDPEGYVRALKQTVARIDDVTVSYVAESVAAFNRSHLLSATMALGVASENLMLTLIEVYANWLTEPRKTRFRNRIEDRWISTQYREFKKEFSSDVGQLPAELRGDWETYLDGIFNFVRLNRNSAGHPTGKQMSSKVVYANLQIFADYAAYIFKLCDALR